MRNYSLRIQAMLSRRTFTLSHVASLRRWYGDSATSPASRQCRHRVQGEARPDRSVRAPVSHPAPCRAAPAVATVRRAHASAAAPPAGDCLEESPAEVRSACPASPAGFLAVRSASATTAQALRCSSPAIAQRGRFSSTSNQQRIAAGSAGLDITARAHVGDAVFQPFVFRQVLDHHRARPQR